MAVDLRQVMASFLTFSMFVMLGNMIKKDHIDPLLEPLPETPTVKYNELKVSKPAMLKLSELNYGPWLEQDEAVGRPCWKKPTLRKQQSDGYIFFSLTHGPEYHASQVANAVALARKLGATLALPDIKGDKLGEKRNFDEVYNVDKFVASLSGVVRVEKNPPADQGRLPIVRVPNGVSDEYISSRIKPIFHRRRNLKIVTYNFNDSSANNKVIKGQVSNEYQCLAMFESLKLQPELQELADSMVGTLRSFSTKMNGRFIAIDLRVEMLVKKRCFNAEEIGKFLKKIGFHSNTSLYLTQTGWHGSLNALRNIFPNSFIKDAIMPADEKAKFMELKSRGYEKYIDFYMCTQGDVFVPAFPSRFYGSVVGERIGLGKTRIFLPAKKTTSESAIDYISPYIAKKDHFAYSCLC